MATKGSMKGFYRQKKKSGIAKASSKKSSAPKSKPHASFTLGSDVAQPPALFSHGSPDLQDDYDEKEELLRQFDLNMAYGPCAGMTRLARWERASKLGMNPPQEIGALLKASNVRSQSLWDDRI
ncbi:uncharacterized protein LOC107404725 [Ziziphus jujuba]|uniref:Uncharacterized protein LOC107404725 n=1 Tax=Ziziphus jujuba TaxID=326968 RepID=A0A6P3YT45_ZIZJJ|nr:uncharacterized protein LOC107404725 [Ziziphus jujuba]